ncbi:MAG TPA: hybrid sensor histidine kinase/response regulator, partial [Candidatus Scalindua sp.]|nr:hybrid sensor histidine kinase/response regulator [Candidatus Scalindua sp.]
MSKVMLVDDEAVITMQLEKRLPTMGYDVVGTASSGEESILMARDLKPSLILMDIVMPGRLDGIDAAEIISKELDIPIIFLTAYTDDKFIERAKNVEPYGYIIKPFNEREIRPNIEIALYKKESEQRQKHAVERIRKLSSVVEQSPCMIMITDTKGNIEYVNPRFTQFTGYTSEEVIGKNLRFLKSGEMPPEVYKELWDMIMSGREWRGEFCNKKKNGEIYWEYAFISPIKDVEG